MAVYTKTEAYHGNAYSHEGRVPFLAPCRSLRYHNTFRTKNQVEKSLSPDNL